MALCCEQIKKKKKERRQLEGYRSRFLVTRGASFGDEYVQARQRRRLSMTTQKKLYRQTYHGVSTSTMLNYIVHPLLSD